MRLSDYVVDFFVKKGVTDFYGYQGTMISYFVDAVARNASCQNHSCYNEQGAAFAACGSAQADGNLAVAYATSGPGAINLLSGVANAYYDSLPVVFLTGQVNTYEYVTGSDVRQHTFQEADVVGMAKPVTKYAVKVEDPESIRYELEKACYLATSGRPGAVLLDIPMNIQRAEIDVDQLAGFEQPEPTLEDPCEIAATIAQALKSAKRPAFLIGNGLTTQAAQVLRGLAAKHRIPVITSLLGRRLLSTEDEVNFGFLGGAYGHREANLIAAKKSDLLVCLGISMVTRQTGVKVDQFATNAKVLWVDVDQTAFARTFGAQTTTVLGNANEAIEQLAAHDLGSFEDWFGVCATCKKELRAFDQTLPERKPNHLVQQISQHLGHCAAVVSDVGQHMMWVGQSFQASDQQTMLYSGGHGAMGYALPAAIGAHYRLNAPVCAVAGDGAFQMNPQELAWVAREDLPIVYVVLNNHSLGMVRVQQKMYFNSEFEGTSEGFHYSACNAADVARAYGIPAVRISEDDPLDAVAEQLQKPGPFVLEVMLDQDSFAYPKTVLGCPVWDQSPRIGEELMEKLLAL